MILDLPETAKITKRQKCPVVGIETGNYTLRSGHSPLAEVSIECDSLSQATINQLISQIEQAKGIDHLELPYISSTEHYLVQEYRVIPILYGELAKLSLKMVQQRSELIPADPTIITIYHVALYDSFKTVNFRNYAQQFNKGIQRTKEKGSWRSSENYWDVVFHLTLTEAQNLDNQLTQKRGLHPFKWSPIGSSYPTEAWLCSEWEIEYFACDLHIFSGKFLFHRPIPIEAFYQPSSALGSQLVNPVSFSPSSVRLLIN